MPSDDMPPDVREGHYIKLMIRGGERMKIGDLIRSLNTAVVMLLLGGGIALYLSVPDLIISFKPAISFEELLEEDGSVTSFARLQSKTAQMRRAGLME